MSTVKGGLGARILKRARCEKSIEVCEEIVLVRQMSAELQIAMQLEFESIKKEAGESETEEDVDIAKINPELLARLATECCYDDEGNPAFANLDQAKQLPFKPLVKILAAVTQITQEATGEGEDGDADPKAGSTERATS